MFQSLLLDSQIVEVAIVVLYLHKNGNFNRIYLERWFFERYRCCKVRIVLSCWNRTFCSISNPLLNNARIHFSSKNFTACCLDSREIFPYFKCSIFVTGIIMNLLYYSWIPDKGVVWTFGPRSSSFTILLIVVPYETSHHNFFVSLYVFVPL
jgi:hypothetical protein